MFRRGKGLRRLVTSSSNLRHQLLGQTRVEQSDMEGLFAQELVSLAGNGSGVSDADRDEGRGVTGLADCLPLRKYPT